MSQKKLEPPSRVPRQKGEECAWDSPAAFTKMCSKQNQMQSEWAAVRDLAHVVCFHLVNEGENRIEAWLQLQVGLRRVGQNCQELQSLSFTIFARWQVSPQEPWDPASDKGPTCPRHNQPPKHHFSLRYPYSPNGRGDREGPQYIPLKDMVGLPHSWGILNSWNPKLL